MREAAFVKQNKEKWIAFEKAINLSSKTILMNWPMAIIQLTNDLAYAQTYYAESKTLLYLNSLASQAHQKFIRTKRKVAIGLSTSGKPNFRYSLLTIKKHWESHFLIFIVASAIGAISACNDATFVRLILGDG